MKNLHWLQQQSPITLSQEEARAATEQVLWVKFSAFVLKMKLSARPSGGWESSHQKAKIRQRKWGSPQTCLSSWEHLIALWCSWTFSSAWSSLFSSPRYHHHHHLDHYHHVRLNLPSFSQRNPLTMCPPTAATAPTLDEGDFFQGQDFIHYDSPGNKYTVYLRFVLLYCWWLVMVIMMMLTLLVLRT